MKERFDLLQQENTMLNRKNSGMQETLNTIQAYFFCIVNDKFPNEKSRIANVVSALERQGISPSKNTVSKHYKAGETARFSKNTLELKNEEIVINELSKTGRSC